MILRHHRHSSSMATLIEVSYFFGGVSIFKNMMHIHSHTHTLSHRNGWMTLPFFCSFANNHIPFISLFRSVEPQSSSFRGGKDDMDDMDDMNDNDKPSAKS